MKHFKKHTLSYCYLQYSQKETESVQELFSPLEVCLIPIWKVTLDMKTRPPLTKYISPSYYIYYKMFFIESCLIILWINKFKLIHYEYIMLYAIKMYCLWEVVPFTFSFTFVVVLLYHQHTFKIWTCSLLAHITLFQTVKRYNLLLTLDSK